MDRFVIFQTPFEWSGLVSGESVIKRVFLGYKTTSILRGSILKTFPAAKKESNDLLEDGRVMIVDYLSGKRFSLDLPSVPFKGTLFQRMVWEATKGIPYGETRTYGWVGRRVSKPKASRAVGQALANNPLPLIVPCHRVVRSDGEVGDFSLPGGSDLKYRLIELERSLKSNRVL